LWLSSRGGTKESSHPVAPPLVTLVDRNGEREREHNGRRPVKNRRDLSYRTSCASLYVARSLLVDASSDSVPTGYVSICRGGIRTSDQYSSVIPPRILAYPAVPPLQKR